MNNSLLKNIVINAAIAATAIAASIAAPVSGETLFSLAAIGGIAAIAFTDYRARHPLRLRLAARPVAARRRAAALLAA